MKIKIAHSWPKFKVTPEWTLFLDRDGVINERLPGDYIKNWEEFRFIKGVLESLSIFNNFFNRIFIVTNQAGIEKGILSHEMLHALHNQMMEYILYHGGRVDEIYYCPNTGDVETFCRKPNPGMAFQAQKDYPEVDFAKSLMVGDSESDIIFGNNLGMKTILVGNKSENTFAAHNSIPDSRMDSLADVANYINNI